MNPRDSSSRTICLSGTRGRAEAENVTEWLASLRGEPGKDGAVSIDNLKADEGDVLQYIGGHWLGAPMKGGGSSIMVLGYDESIAYLDSDDEQDPTGGSAVSPDILSNADTMDFLDGAD